MRILLFQAALLFSLAASAELVLLKPTSVVTEKKTGTRYKGVYKPMEDNGDYQADKLVEVNSEKYDELVLTYTDVKPGSYLYRLSKLSKRGVEVSNWSSGDGGGCTSEPIEQALANVVNNAVEKIERVEVLSPNKSGVARLRLTAEMPEDVIYTYIGGILAIACPDTTWAQELAWKMAPKPSTKWFTLHVKSASALVIRLPAELASAKFELAIVK